MATSALRPCSYPGCGKLTKTGRCEVHVAIERRQVDERRGGATARGYGYSWQKASKAFLRAHPLCMCEDCREGALRVTPATVVDHHEPHRGDMELFWDRGNWRSMAKECHDRKTAREDGAFGRQQMPGGAVQS